MLDTKQIGNLTELQCITRLYELGYPISIPFGDSEKYDLILDVNNNLYRVQVKHGTMEFNENGEPDVLIIKTRWQSGYTKTSSYKNHKYTKFDCDFIGTFYDGKVYLIPIEECSLEKRLRFSLPKVKQPTINYAKDYVDEEVLSKL